MQEALYLNGYAYPSMGLMLGDMSESVVSKGLSMDAAPADITARASTRAEIGWRDSYLSKDIICGKYLIHF